MNKNIKLIIFGFALMFMGGVSLITGAIIKQSMPVIFVYLQYGLFIGFILIIIGLFTEPKNHN